MFSGAITAPVITRHATPADAALLADLAASTFRDTFAIDEAVVLFCDPLPLADINSIWDAFKPKIQISAPYVARMISIDSFVGVAETGPAAQTRALDFGKVGVS